MKKIILFFLCSSIILYACEPSSDELRKMKDDAQKTTDSIKWAVKKQAQQDSSLIKK